MCADSLFNAFARSFEVRSETDMSMAEYLESCRGDPMRYANAAERPPTGRERATVLASVKGKARAPACGRP